MGVIVDHAPSGDREESYSMNKVRGYYINLKK